MDIKGIIQETDLYTLHSHTQFCDGRAAMVDFASEAQQQGFKHYGFSPHSPVPFDSPCNMSIDSVPQYLSEVERIRGLFPSINFYAGMEIDYIDENWGPNTDYFRNLGLDYSIGSLHFIPNQDGEFIDIDGRFEKFKSNVHEKFHDDINYVVRTYFEQSNKMVDAGGFDIIGHFDKIKHNAGLFMPGLEQTDWYQRLVNELIDNIIQHNYIIEINTKAWKEHHQLFPAQQHWRRLLQAGATIVVNSDAHYPKLINASRLECIKALKYLNNSISKSKNI